MTRILIVKTGALGDVLRTTSILRGLAARYAASRITWVTAPEAVELVARHPLVAQVEVLDTLDPSALDTAIDRLSRDEWDLVLSFDDEHAQCRLASVVPARRRSGALCTEDGRREYTDDVAEWFGMGLLARDGKAAADRRKRANTRSHPTIFASMLGIEAGRPELPLDDDRLTVAAFRLGLPARRARGPLVGLNTGAGGRWPSKAIPVDRCVALAAELHARHRGAIGFVLLGGREEAARNAAIALGLRALPTPVDFVDTGIDNPLPEFAALIANCDLLVSSDSLGLHIAIARRVPVVAFFAPTSGAEIELFDLGEKVISTDPDYCSYRADTSNESITVVRLADACDRVLAAAPVSRPSP